MIPAQRANDTTPPAPGVHDLPEDVYHSDTTSMSSTAAKHILNPGCPAIVKWEAENPVFKDAFDIGTVTHKLILGVGQEIVEVDADSWQTKAAKEARAEARERGAVPILSKDLHACRLMADAVRAHPLAGKYLDENRGHPERSVFWIDEETGIRRRAMLDWFPNPDAPGQPVAVDIKTTSDASPKAIAKTVANFTYIQQDPFYRDGLASVGMDDAGFLFLFVCNKPPHLVTVAQLDDEAVELGYRRNREAIRIWADCQARDEWPGYPEQIHTISLPRWAARDLEVTE